MRVIWSSSYQNSSVNKQDECTFEPFKGGNDFAMNLFNPFNTKDLDFFFTYFISIEFTQSIQLECFNDIDIM